MAYLRQSFWHSTMQEAAATQSIDSSRSSIGSRAAQHLDRTFRHMMLGQGAEQGGNFLRLVTGEQHPLGSLAIVSDPRNAATTQTAIGPLLGRGFPAAALYTEGVTAALAVGYGLPPGVARMFSPEAFGADMAPDARMQFFAIRQNGRIVATSLFYLADGLAGIYCVATLSEERGKVLGAHVTAEALRAAHRLGYRVGVLQSSDAGHSAYLRLGFEDLGTVPMFVRMPV